MSQYAGKSKRAREDRRRVLMLLRSAQPVAQNAGHERQFAFRHLLVVLVREQWRTGAEVDGRNTELRESGDVGPAYDKSNLPKGPLSIVWIVISILVGVGLAMFIVGRMKAQLKTVRFQAAAGDYMKSGSLNITESRDVFLYNTVTRTAKPKNTDSGSSGGSSTHTSSSGTTHGGGGGKF